MIATAAFQTKPNTVSYAVVYEERVVEPALRCSAGTTTVRVQPH
jgi:hypothetical protein